MSGSLVTFKTGEGLEIRGALHRLTRDAAVFEIYGPDPALRMSEALSEFTLLDYERPIYTGKAVVAKLIQSGPCTVCEAQLEEAWVDGRRVTESARSAEVLAGFEQFMQQWGKTYRVLPEFKVAIADLHSFLLDLRLWLDQAELTIRASPGGSRRQLEHDWLDALTPSTTAAIGVLYDRFDAVARTIEPELVPMHQGFGRRHLHPLILAAPFVYRTLQKPLGYAGDYEMVNMMMRDPYEGPSLFAKVFNACALSRPPIVAHRNRLAYLADTLVQETVRRWRRPGPFRVLSVGCGPAHEIQTYLRRDPCSDRAEFTLVDFDAETLDHVGRALSECQRSYGRATTIRTLRRSVQQLLKTSAKPSSGQAGEQYDLAYCAGLFDYLPSPICRSLVGYFYELLAPGGLLLVTNVDTHSSRNEMEYFLEWHLIYRDTKAMLDLVPPRVPPDAVRVFREPAGINIFLEIRKPENDAPGQH